MAFIHFHHKVLQKSFKILDCTPKNKFPNLTQSLFCNSHVLVTWFSHNHKVIICHCRIVHGHSSPTNGCSTLQSNNTCRKCWWVYIRLEFGSNGHSSLENMVSVCLALHINYRFTAISILTSNSLLFILHNDTDACLSVCERERESFIELSLTFYTHNARVMTTRAMFWES